MENENNNGPGPEVSNEHGAGVTTTPASETETAEKEQLEEVVENAVAADESNVNDTGLGKDEPQGEREFITTPDPDNGDPGGKKITESELKEKLVATPATPEESHAVKSMAPENTTMKAEGLSEEKRKHAYPVTGTPKDFSEKRDELIDKLDLTKPQDPRMVAQRIAALVLDEVRLKELIDNNGITIENNGDVKVDRSKVNNMEFDMLTEREWPAGFESFASQRPADAPAQYKIPADDEQTERKQEQPKPMPDNYRTTRRGL